MATLLRHRLAIFAIVIVGTFFLPAAFGAQEKAASNSSRAAREEDIHAAAFLFLFDVNKEPGRGNPIYCLSDGKWKVSVPPDAEIDMSRAYIARDEERSGN